MKLKEASIREVKKCHKEGVKGFLTWCTVIKRPNLKQNIVLESENYAIKGSKLKEMRVPELQYILIEFVE